MNVSRNSSADDQPISVGTSRSSSRLTYYDDFLSHGSIPPMISRPIRV
jgi:hypothetical protein